MGLLLTDAERQRFTSWLIREAETNEGMAQHMGDNPLFAPKVKQLKVEALAMRVVARYINEWETVVIE